MIFPVRKAEKYAYINNQGRLLCDFIYTFASRESEGCVFVTRAQRTYCLNSRLELLFECCSDFDYHHMGFCGGVCLITDTKSKKMGFVDMHNNVLLSPSLECIYCFTGPLAPYRDSRVGKYGLLDNTGNILLPERFDECSSFREINGLAAYKLGDRWGLVDSRGSNVTEPIFCYTESSSEGLVVAKTESGYWQYLDVLGSVVISCANNVERAYGFKDGLAAVSVSEKWGFIDNFGKLAIDCVFDRVCEFSEGMAVVGKGGQYMGSRSYQRGFCGVINKKGQLVIPFSFEWIGSYRGGIAEYEIDADSDDSKMGYINMNGEIVWNAN